MSHAFSGLFGGGKSSPVVYIQPPAAPSMAQSIQPVTQPVTPSAPGGAQSPSFLGSATIPPPAPGGQSQGKSLLGS